MKKLILPVLLFISLHNITGQTISSVSFDSESVFQFTADAIYFNAPQGFIKTDYHLNVIWAKDIPLANANSIFFTHDGIYGLDGNYAFKYDSSGNFVWKIDLSNKVCTVSVDANVLNAIAVSDNRIYVQIHQGNWNSSNYFYGVITLDTSGSVINSICHGFTSKVNIGKKGIPSFSKGAWIALDASGGGYGDILVVKYDSTGGLDQNANRINVGGGNYHDFVDLIALADSTLLIVNYFGHSTFSSSVIENISCTKFSEQGYVLWENSFTSPYKSPFTQHTLAEAKAVTSDENSNIYIKASVMDSAYNYDMRPVIIKMDKDGNILSVKAWSDSLINSPIQIGDKLFYRGGVIYASGKFGNKDALIVLDTAFGNPCFTLDTTMSWANYPPFSSSFSNSFYLRDPYVAPKVSSIPSNSISSTLKTTDICFSLHTNDKLFIKTSCTISPNPFHTTTTLEIKNKEFSHAELKIYDRMGRQVQRQIINSPSTIIHRSSLADGIYFYQLISDKGQMVSGKFVVE